MNLIIICIYYQIINKNNIGKLYNFKKVIYEYEFRNTPQIK